MSLPELDEVTDNFDTFEWFLEICYSSCVNDNVAISNSPSNHPAVLNKVGLIVLLVGLVSALIVYWVGQNRAARQQPATTADGEWKDGTLSTEDSKIANHTIELYGGPVEMLMVRFDEAVKHPEWQAVIIAAVSTLIALACFLAARNLSTAR